LNKVWFVKQTKNHHDLKHYLFRTDSPVKYGYGECEKETSYIIVSESSQFTGYGFREGEETYIFPADENGKVVNWGGLNGSMDGSLDYKKALVLGGYEVVEESE